MPGKGHVVMGLPYSLLSHEDSSHNEQAENSHNHDGHRDGNRGGCCIWFGFRCAIWLS